MDARSCLAFRGSQVAKATLRSPGAAIGWRESRGVTTKLGHTHSCARKAIPGQPSRLHGRCHSAIAAAYLSTMQAAGGQWLHQEHHRCSLHAVLPHSCLSATALKVARPRNGSCKRATTEGLPIPTALASVALAAEEHAARLSQGNGRLRTLDSQPDSSELPLVDPEDYQLPAGELSLVDIDGPELPADVFRCPDCRRDECRVS